MSGRLKISVVVPCYNEAANIPGLLRELEAQLGTSPYDWSCVFVDDGSTDGTLEVLRQSLSGYPNSLIVELSRNFGKEAGIMAGLEHAQGDIVVLMDADLQDPPNLLLPMIEAVVSDGYDMAAAHRSDRASEPPLRSFFSSFFYRVWNCLASNRLIPGARDYRVMSRAVVDSVISLKECNRFSKGIFEWVGFKTKYFSFENRAREEGKSGWSIRKLFSYALDGLFSFSIVPLRFASLCGVIISIGAFLWMGWVIFKTIVFGDPVAGYPSLVSILLFVSGIQLLCLGLIGEYLGRTYQEAKARPKYLVRSIYHSGEDQPSA